MSSVFPGTATSGVIGGLDPATEYQFQVFATVTVDGVPLEGENSPVTSKANLNNVATRSHYTHYGDINIALYVVMIMIVWLVCFY